MAASPTEVSSTPTRRQLGLDGGFTILAVAIVTSVLTGPGQTIGVSVFIDHFVEDLNLTRSQVSTAYLIGTLSGAALLPRVGRFIDDRGVRLSQMVAGALFALALVNMSFVNGFVWLAIGFVGIRFFGQGSLSLVSVVTVSIRYLSNRGTALGLYSTVSSALMALLPLALAFSIGAVGWRSAWLVSAAIVASLVLGLAWFGLRDMPARRSAATAETDDVVVDNSFDRAEAIRTRGFWLLAAVSASAGMLGTALNFHQIDLLGDAGLSTNAAAALFIPQVVGSTVAGLATGWLADRMGTRYLPAAGAGLLVVSLLLAAVASPGVIVVIYAIVLGAMGGGIRTTASLLLPTWFGVAHLGSIQGTLTVFNVGASALGPVALAITQDWFGSYPPAVLVLALIPAATLVFALGPKLEFRSLEAHPPSTPSD